MPCIRHRRVRREAPVIASFGDRATEALFHGVRGKGVKRLPPQIFAVAVRKLDMLNSARVLQDLASPPGNRLEALHGDLAGLHSIRINDQWRIVFRWEAGDAHDVRIADYHR
jgi:proteic killer suppression protein